MLQPDMRVQNYIITKLLYSITHTVIKSHGIGPAWGLSTMHTASAKMDLLS